MFPLPTKSSRILKPAFESFMFIEVCVNFYWVSRTEWLNIKTNKNKKRNYV